MIGDGSDYMGDVKRGAGEEALRRRHRPLPLHRRLRDGLRARDVRRRRRALGDRLRRQRRRHDADHRGELSRSRSARCSRGSSQEQAKAGGPKAGVDHIYDSRRATRSSSSASVTTSRSAAASTFRSGSSLRSERHDDTTRTSPNVCWSVATPVSGGRPPGAGDDAAAVPAGRDPSRLPAPAGHAARVVARCEPADTTHPARELGHRRRIRRPERHRTRPRLVRGRREARTTLNSRAGR